MSAWRAAGLVAVAALAISAGRMVITPLAAQEPEAPKTLMPGKGVELTTTRCVICHDAQHITRARLSRDEWAYNIKNMIERGAPIAADEIPVILEYLATYYNRDSAPPAAESVAASASQDPVQRLLTTNACVACHSVEQRGVGPSFKEVAAKFAGDDSAAERLAKKIREGGAGAWGSVPMPAHPGLTQTELDAIIGWVLSRR